MTCAAIKSTGETGMFVMTVTTEVMAERGTSAATEAIDAAAAIAAV